MPFDAILGFHLLCLAAVFALGSVVGSFANVCIHRLPWEKSVLWPASHCPRCLMAIAARDNVPIAGWLLLGGKCRTCALPISPRYPLIEALSGTLFAAAYAADVMYGTDRLFAVSAYGRMIYHQLLITCLLIATFIDFDYYVIPDSVTITGMLLGLGLGTAFPGLRAAPAEAATHWNGLLAGLIGWGVGGALVWLVRFVGSVVARREAMGFGDVTLLAMIGAFMGWQFAVITFFLAPFFGLAQSVFRLVRIGIKRGFGKQVSQSENEIPFGPYLSMAAVILVLFWTQIWSHWLGPWFDNLKALFA
jgi:leader peptidase (prepilin peptidase)/N-methyltransferase